MQITLCWIIPLQEEDEVLDVDDDIDDEVTMGDQQPSDEEVW